MNDYVKCPMCGKHFIPVSNTCPFCNKDINDTSGLFNDFFGDIFKEGKDK